ncbi:tripartite tricarboxylate transporter TctB family protein [bacterium LRH843]|nr:tripartite tricarboxylate transporter TctB family protein [bacterium LRH843]
MRVIFSSILLALSLFFTIYGWRYEYFNNSGQVGSGFFPIWIGALLILFITITLIKDIKLHLKERTKLQITDNVVTILIIVGITIIFIATMKLFGALLGMIIYIFAVLFVLNREKIGLNTFISLIASFGCYFLLDVWLNAGLPKGIFGF